MSAIIISGMLRLPIILMRAIVLGNKDLAVNCLEVLLANKVDVTVTVVNADDDGRDDDKWYKSLRKAATARGIPCYQPPNISSEQGMALIEKYAPEYLFSFSYNHIVRKQVLEKLPYSLNIHFGDLPHYRGCLPIVHAMANCETHIGVSLHFMDEGIDTGDIVDQIHIDVLDHDTAYTVYFKAVAAGTALFSRTLPKLLSGEFTRFPQDLAAGSYFKQEYPNDRWLDSAWPASKQSCFIRAHTFPGYPAARIRFSGTEAEVYFAEGFYSVPALNLSQLSLIQLHQVLKDHCS